MLIKRLAAVYLILLAVVVAGHFLATQFYDPTPEGTARNVWQILNPLMVIGIVITLIVALDETERRDNPRIFGGFTFYFSAALLISLTGSVLSGWSHATTMRAMALIGSTHPPASGCSVSPLPAESLPVC